MVVLGWFLLAVGRVFRVVCYTVAMPTPSERIQCSGRDPFARTSANAEKENKDCRSGEYARARARDGLMSGHQLSGTAITTATRTRLPNTVGPHNQTIWRDCGQYLKDGDLARHYGRIALTGYPARHYGRAARAGDSKRLCGRALRTGVLARLYGRALRAGDLKRLCGRALRLAIIVRHQKNSL